MWFSLFKSVVLKLCHSMFVRYDNTNLLRCPSHKHQRRLTVPTWLLLLKRVLLTDVTWASPSLACKPTTGRDVSEGVIAFTTSCRYRKKSSNGFSRSSIPLLTASFVVIDFTSPKTFYIVPLKTLSLLWGPRWVSSRYAVPKINKSSTFAILLIDMLSIVL